MKRGITVTLLMVELARRAAPLRWALVSLSLASSHAADPAPAKPNILWIVMDDVGVELPCHGEKSIQTPNIDRLVREGTRFERAFLTSSVCSPSRSVMITGMYQTTIGAHHHRSGRGTEKIQLPAGVEPVPAILQRAGYHTSNGDYPAKGKRVGKTDYNFEWDPGIYDEGIRTPFIVRDPGIPRGAVRGDLIEHIDMAATTLAWAGLPVPPWMQGRDLFARDYKPRDAVFAARDRCGETVDRIRSVRTERFKYIRNFHPRRPLLQPNDYKDSKPFLPVLRDLHAQGKLSPLQEEIRFRPPVPPRNSTRCGPTRSKPATWPVIPSFNPPWKPCARGWTAGWSRPSTAARSRSKRMMPTSLTSSAPRRAVLATKPCSKTAG